MMILCKQFGIIIMVLTRSKFKGKYRIASDRLKDWDY